MIKVDKGGVVLYDYEIMRDPVTNAEYAAWLNTLDPEEAARHYCPLMTTHFFGGVIVDNGLSGLSGLGEGAVCGTVSQSVKSAQSVVKYATKPGYEKKPVVFVSWFDALGYATAQGGRLPTADEWLKAAAWLPKEGRLAVWCTGRDEAPTQEEAIFYDDIDGWALPAPHLAEVDWYKPSGAYGCRGMAGNVAEWVDAEMPNGWKRALGGSVFRPRDIMRTDSGEGDRPDKRLSTFGFRVVRERQ